MSKIDVAVLMGGISAERTVSLSTGRQILQSLDQDKYTPVGIDAAAIGRVPGSDAGDMAPFDLAALAEASGRPRPDVVFVALHGRGGEDGSVQGLLELLGLRYTGSGILASALAMDKAAAKRVLRHEGVPVPDGLVLDNRSAANADDVDAAIVEALGYPVVVKPSREGSTFGCSIARSRDELAAALDAAFARDSVVLVEEFLPGMEITVGVLGNRTPEALPTIEIVPTSGFYDYEAKYAAGGSRHVIPARLPEETLAEAAELACNCHQALGCRGMSRTDMIVSDRGLVVLETNTIPGMTPTSLLPEAAQAAGIPFPDLLDRIIGLALED